MVSKVVSGLSLRNAVVIDEREREGEWLSSRATSHSSDQILDLHGNEVHGPIKMESFGKSNSQLLLSCCFTKF